jgi:hypothetical protein
MQSFAASQARRTLNEAFSATLQVRAKAHPRPSTDSVIALHLSKSVPEARLNNWSAMPHARMNTHEIRVISGPSVVICAGAGSCHLTHAG